jgi:hypothetical protein
MHWWFFFWDWCIAWEALCARCAPPRVLVWLEGMMPLVSWIKQDACSSCPRGISKKIGYMQCGLLVVRTWAFPLRGLLVVRTWAFPLRDGILVGCNYVCFSLRAAVLNGPTAACCPALHINGTQAHCCIVCLCDGIPLLCRGSTERGPRSVSGLFSSRAGRGSGGTPGWLAGLEGRQPGFPLVRWVDSRFSSGSAGRQLVFPVIFTVSDDVKKTSRNNPYFNIR